MSSPNDVSMEDDDRDSIEYKILMAYAQRRLSVSKYGKLLKNEANVCKSQSLISREVETDCPRDKDGPSRGIINFQIPTTKVQSKTQLKGKSLPVYDCRAEQEKFPTLPFFEDQEPCYSDCNIRFESPQEWNSQHQTRLAGGNKERAFKYSIFSESGHIDELNTGNSTLRARSNILSSIEQYTHVSQYMVCLRLARILIAFFVSHFPSQSGERADVNRIADKLAKLVTSRSQKFLRLAWPQGPSVKRHDSDGKEYDEEMIQTIVSLLRKSGDELEEMIQKDRTFYQRFEDMLSYTFFKSITDLFLKCAVADSPSEPESQVQRVKVAFIMEVATRLNAVDNHPMNLVLGFGLKYLREHFKPWIQDQGGWEKAFESLDEEEVE
ncbi:BCL2-like 14 (apoptosis facilitator) [Columba livia]|uniref:BCL2-like 14 (Apoptosis facilitator) n=1 Tax=Columba livia TaxID=8932 RepID=A0A2I0MKP1_COLLI|nr:BCL2-like 14 (apoptosis facilitator) [Columba livia]